MIDRYALVLAGGFVAACALTGAGIGTLYVIVRSLYDY